MTGYLYISSDYPWPDRDTEINRVPEPWLVTDPDTDHVEVIESKKKYLPTPVWLRPDGGLDTTRTGLPAWFVSTPFAFCMRCGVSYEQVRGQDFGKLATLDAEGRSSAVSLLSASLVRSLKSLPESQLSPTARKLLTFVDNRQDASLQAGHFNDFVQVSQLRAALYAALVKAGPDGLTHDVLGDVVTDTLGLRMVDFAQAPEAKFSAKKDAERALRAAVEYQLYVDLQRGWRVTMPNLEQTGLLKLDLPRPARARRGRGVLGGHLPPGPDQRRAAAGAVPDPARRAAPGPRDRGRLPDRGRLRPAQAPHPRPPHRTVESG